MNHLEWEDTRVVRNHSASSVSTEWILQAKHAGSWINVSTHPSMHAAEYARYRLVEGE